MNIYDTIMTRRTIRKFKQEPIARDLLKKLIDAARMAPTGANRQPLSFAIVTDKELCNKIFPLTSWAGYLKGTYTPSESERPTAYIAVFTDTENKDSSETAAGAAVENILILAHSEGIGSCWMGAINREKIPEIIGSPKDKYLLYIVALGYPAESPVPAPYTDDVKYYLDKQNVLHVPKKSIDDVLIINS